MVKYDEIALIEEYKKCKRCRIVAEKYGCSDETVRRALIKYNVPRILKAPRPVTKKKATEEELRQIVDDYYSSDASINELAQKWKRSQTIISRAIKQYGHGLKWNPTNRKITLEQLRNEAKLLNCREIAIKYGLSDEQVYRRAKKHGIEINARGVGGHWRTRSSRYGLHESGYDDSITLKRCIEKYGGVCQICGKPVDENDIKNGHIRRNYPTVDHIIPLSKGGLHTWDNVQLAHMACNAGKCDRG